MSTLPMFTKAAEFPRGIPPDGMDVLWRCEAKRYSVAIDADREEYGVSDPVLSLVWYKVERRTPKGAYLAGSEPQRFVRLTARSRYAAPSTYEAVADFAGRRSRQRHILSCQVSRCKAEQELAAAWLAYAAKPAPVYYKSAPL